MPLGYSAPISNVFLKVAEAERNEIQLNNMNSELKIAQKRIKSLQEALIANNDEEDSEDDVSGIASVHNGSLTGYLPLVYLHFLYFNLFLFYIYQYTIFLYLNSNQAWLITIFINVFHS